MHRDTRNRYRYRTIGTWPEELKKILLLYNHYGRRLESTLSIAPHSIPTKGNTQTKENTKAGSIWK